MSQENYFLAADKTYEGLKRKVNDWIEAGFVPTGGIVIVQDHFMQALVNGEVLRKWHTPPTWQGGPL